MSQVPRSGAFPAVITHTYDPRRGPLRNLCALPDAEAEAILRELRTAGRRIKPDYLQRRRSVEAWLLAEAGRKIRDVRLPRPLYFFLGAFDDGRDPARPAALVLPLALFGAEMLTFTYPDSMASLPLGRCARHRDLRRPHHGQVFTLAEIRALVAREGLPDPAARGAAAHPYDRFVEVQVWNDGPLRSHRVTAPTG